MAILLEALVMFLVRYSSLGLSTLRGGLASRLRDSDLAGATNDGGPLPEVVGEVCWGEFLVSERPLM